MSSTQALISWLDSQKNVPGSEKTFENLQLVIRLDIEVKKQVDICRNRARKR